MADRSEIDEVLARTDLVATIEQYVTLKRAGSSLKGLCPFHNEKTPSFQVTPDRGLWKCFGCGEGGDVIKFVEKIENLSFPEALERLAMRAGITLTRNTAPGTSAGAPAGLSERDRIYRANGLALRYYRDCLAVSELAREYLDQRRIGTEAQQEFQLGFAPEGWDGLTSFLMRQKLPLADAELAGLISKNDHGGYYDRLRGRLIFPIFDVQDRPVAFGGRILVASTTGQPKYWNSPEHPAFSKSKTLYGLNRARKPIAETGTAILVEGYTDVISAHQAGLRNVVAPLGTSLTEEHVKMLAPLGKAQGQKVYSIEDKRDRLVFKLCFDADSAGLKAAFRAADIFEKYDIDARVFDLPGGEDPDSLLRDGRVTEFEDAMKAAAPLIDYQLQIAIRTTPIRHERDRADLWRKVTPILASVKSVVQREEYIGKVAKFHPAFQNYRPADASMVENQIRQDVAAYLANHTRSADQRQNRSTEEGPDPGRRQPTLREATELAERHLLRALLSANAELSARVMSALQPAQFVTERGRRLAAQLYGLVSADPNLEAARIIGAIGGEESAEELTDIVMETGAPLSVQLVDDNAAYLKRKAMEVEQSYLKEIIDRGEASKESIARHAQLAVQLKGSRASTGVGTHRPA